MADLSTPEGKLVERLKPAWVIDEPAGEAVSILRRIGDYEPVVDALNRFIVTNNALKSEAADALSRIAAERDEAALKRDMNDALAVANGKRALEEHYRASAAERERDELKAEVERLRGALKPFAPDATMSQLLWGDQPDDSSGTVTVKLGDFRRALLALHGEGSP